MTLLWLYQAAQGKTTVSLHHVTMMVSVKQAGRATVANAQMTMLVQTVKKVRYQSTVHTRYVVGIRGQLKLREISEKK